ncbi:MAG: stage 0 sporulation protein [Victivallaceae bacterium]|nr:stage 0 sporulation protein [Victivallaceae bacterium]
MDQVFLLKIENGIALEAHFDSDETLAVGDVCVFSRDFYRDLGEVVRKLDAPTMTANIRELPEILRRATDDDLAEGGRAAARNRPALKQAQDFVDKLALPMKLVNAHSSLDGKLVTVQFCADGRVDFRELVKELSRALSTRIELRQIGVRDETAMYGGIAVCGQRLCCCRFLHEFSSINVKMAKEQDLALTPSSISGVCGRLKCCLKYEYEGYREMERDMPRKGDYCETPSGNGKVIDRNLLTRRVTVAVEAGNPVSFSRDEVKILPRHAGEPRGTRNGDGARRDPRKNDRPKYNGNRHNGNAVNGETPPPAAQE